MSSGSVQKKSLLGERRQDNYQDVFKCIFLDQSTYFNRNAIIYFFRSLKVCVSMQINTVEDDIVKGKLIFYFGTPGIIFQVL